MRIGISTSVVQRGKTGIAQYLFALLRAFRAEAGHHEFVLFVLEDDLPLFEFARADMRLVLVPERFRSPVRNIVWHQMQLPRLARQWRLDVLHVPSYRRLVFARPCAMVATIHDLAAFRISGKYDWMRTVYAHAVGRFLLPRQDEIIAISGNTADDLTQLCRVRNDRISVIHNGLEHERFFPGDRARARTETMQRYGLDHPFFLYVARLEHPGKNHVRLIAAFDRFKSATGSDWQLVLGGSDWHGADVIHATIRNSPHSSDIRVLGFVPDAELPNLYRAADAFVYPSLYEGFGMPPTEAMACGCPVISSSRGALGEVVGDAAALVDPEDTGSIAAQLAALATNPSFREALRAAGLRQARRFDWRDTAAKTIAIYERAVARRTELRAISDRLDLKSA